MMERLRSFFLRPASVSEPDIRRLASEIAWSQSTLFRTLDQSKANPDDLISRKGHQIYRKMMLDEQVKAVVKFKRDAITSRDFYFEFDDDVELPDTDIEDRIGAYKKMISTVKGSFNDGLNYIMTSMYQGYSLTEITLGIFEYKETPLVGVQGLAPKPYETFSFKVNKFGEIEKCIQELDGEEQEIDLSRFIYFLHNPEFDRHYGQSDLREAYRSWFAKDVIIKLQGIFLERLAGGFITAQPAEGQTLKQNSADFNAIKAIISSLGSASSVLLPSGIDIDVHNPVSTDAFERAITMHDLQIAKALLVPNLLGVTHQGDTGSFAQADRQLEAFLWTLDADANRLADALNEQLFDPLSKMNFADGIGPKFRFKPVSEEKKLEIVKVWMELVKGKAVEATDSDEEHLRELLEFPEKGEPIRDPMPIPAPGGNPNGGPPNAPERDDDIEPGETVVGEEKRIVSKAAMTRATKRVAFAVIDRKSADLEDRHTVAIEERFADMLGNLIRVIEEEKLGTPAGTIEAIRKVDFAPKDKTKSRRAIDAALKDGWSLGLRHSRDEISKARRDVTKLDMARIDEDASAFLKTNGFRMFGNLADDMQKIIQNTLMNGVKFSWTTRDIVNKIYDTLSLAGFIFMETNKNATVRGEDEILEALQEAKINAHRIRTAVRTNTFEALNEARYSSFTDPSLDGFVEALEYSAILDSRTTEICTHLDGRIYPVDSDAWNSIRPPNHFNCRSILVPVTVVDTDVSGKDTESGSRWSKPPRKEPQRGFGGGTG